MRLSIVPFIFLLAPLVEIAGFIMVGQALGVLPTIALIILSTILGFILLRVQGFSAMTRIRQTMSQGGNPGRDMVHAFMIFVAAILLIIPGFVTDSIGLLLFLPFIREAAWTLLKRKLVIVGADNNFSNKPRYNTGTTINLDETEFSSSRSGQEKTDSSPWRHLSRDND